MPSIRNLREFTGHGYDKGSGPVKQILWVLADSMFVRTVWCTPKFRVRILRLFGASIGDRVLIRHGVKIHWPWKLHVNDDVWIGVDAWLLNLEPIWIGANVCISQGAFLCTGSHQASSSTFEFDNGPIHIEEGVWIAARATVLRGVTIGSGSVIGATALVHKDVPAESRVLPAPSQILSRRDA